MSRRVLVIHRIQAPCQWQHRFGTSAIAVKASHMSRSPAVAGSEVPIGFAERLTLLQQALDEPGL
jgi:hypothetical protein